MEEKYIEIAEKIRSKNNIDQTWITPVSCLFLDIHLEETAQYIYVVKIKILLCYILPWEGKRGLANEQTDRY